MRCLPGHQEISGNICDGKQNNGRKQAEVFLPTVPGNTHIKRFLFREKIRHQNRFGSTTIDPPHKSPRKTECLESYSWGLRLVPFHNSIRIRILGWTVRVNLIFTP